MGRPTAATTTVVHYEPGLDGLRAVAVAAVFAFHDGRLAGGFLGVSTFFTLSGFLITRLLLDEHHRTGRIALRRFFARRARRLAPAALAGIALAGGVALVLHDPTTSRAFRFDALAAGADVANWRFLLTGRAYADLFATPSPLQHFWSLAVEEQFYVVLAPLIVAVLHFARGRRRIVGAALAVLALASFVDAHAVARHSIDRAYYATDTRALEFLVGALFAALTVHRRRGRVASRLVAAAGVPAFGVLAVAYLHARVTDPGLFRGGLLAVALSGGTVVVAACEPGPVRALLSRPPLRALGRVSYGVYVYHWPLFLLLTPARTGLAPLPLTVARALSTLGLAAVSLRFLERPVRTRAVLTGPRRWVAAPTAGATVATVAVAVAAIAPVPAVAFAPARSVASVLASAGAREPVSPSASTTGGTHAAARTSGAVERVLVVGDSVAITLGRGIERWGARHDVTVLNDGIVGCTLVDGIPQRGYWGIATRPRDSCGTRASWPRLLRAFRPDVVVVLFGAFDVVDASLDGGHTWTEPGRPDWDALYRSRVADAARRLSATGARVVWLVPPCFGVPPGSARAGGDWYDPAREVVTGRIAHAVAHEVPMTVSDVVHQTGCPVDFATRPDGVHYDDTGADAVAERLGPEITRTEPTAQHAAGS